MNTFVALFPDTELRRAIEKTTAAYRSALGETALRWIRPDAFHITLVFLGDLPPSRLREVTEVFRGRDAPRPAAGHETPRLSLTRIAPFPNPRRPAVVALIADAPDASLPGTREDLLAVLTDRGFTTDRRAWKPHLSLAYLPRRSNHGPIPDAPVEPPIVVVANDVALVVTEREETAHRYRRVTRVEVT